MNNRDAAEQILQTTGALHYPALCDRILAAGLVETSDKTPWETLDAQLASATVNPSDLAELAPS